MSSTTSRKTAATLPLQSAKWADVIESTSGECLLSELSAKNVKHVLSTATVRGPQKTLCAAVVPFVKQMLQSSSGLSILTSLVRYGTPKTVEVVSQALLAAEEATWLCKQQPKGPLEGALGDLLECLMYREDCEGEQHERIVQALKAVKPKALFASSFTLPAAGRLLAADAELAAQITSNAAAKKALVEASNIPATRAAVDKCCELILRGGSAREDAALHLLGSQFIMDAFASAFEPKAPRRPREAVLLALVSHAPLEVVNQVGLRVAAWADLTQLAQREGCMKMIATILDRASDEIMGAHLVQATFTSPGEIDERLASRRTNALHLLAAIGAKPSYVQALNAKLQSTHDKKLKAARVLFTNATVPRSASTQHAVLEKLKQLQQTKPATEPKRAAKRQRE